MNHRHNQKNQEHQVKGKYSPSDFEIDIDKIPDYNYLVEKAKELGKHLAQKNEVKRSQFRRVFTHIKKIQSKVESKVKNREFSEADTIPEEIMKEILLLKPKMAYTAARHRNIKKFYEVVVKFVNKMQTAADFRRFYDFVEATLAYHRYFGGKE